MKPTIGRIVHLSYGGSRVPAIVTYVDEVQPMVCHVHALDGSGVFCHWAEYQEEDAESAANPNSMYTSHLTWAWPPR